VAEEDQPTPPSDYDREAVRAKYLTERDKRLVPGRSATLEIRDDPELRHYLTDPFAPFVDREPVIDDAEVVIVGAGIAGLLVAVGLRQAGIDDIRLIDAAGDVGGTWYWNRYPGIMCDVESYIYMPMLEELGYIPRDRYASGEEIHAHLDAIADRYDLRRGALFHSSVERAEWNADAARWIVTTDRGDRVRSRFYILAVGILNRLKIPDLPGLSAFGGTTFHTARWNYDYTGGGPHDPLTKLADKSVALIGTGATGIQCVEPLGAVAKHVYVLQRTPSAIGVRDNRPTPEDFTEDLGPGWQADRMDNFQSVMSGAEVEMDLIDDAWTHDYASVINPKRAPGQSGADFARSIEDHDHEVMEAHRRRVAEVVEDPATAEALKPFYRYRCKRPCFHDEFLGAFNRANVELVHSPAGIERITEHGFVVDGHEYHVDCIVFASGFEAELTPIHRRAGHEVIGRSGLTLAEKWGDGAASLFGMTSRGFPNLFIMPAPGQQAVVTVNYTHLAVLGAEFVSGTIAALCRAGVRSFDVSEAAEADWIEQILARHVDGTSFLSTCTPSRINNEGDPAAMNPRNGNYGGGFGDFFGYRELLRGWLADGRFEGFELDSGAAPA
jgi:cation diffusion facilitator CzcD-associated flavoprotein CzcO